MGDELEETARQAIAACEGSALVRRAMGDLALDGPAWLVGAGKAAGQMGRGVAAAVEVRGGVLVTKEGAFDGFAPEGTMVRFGGHPEPDGASAAAADALVDFLARRSPDEHVVAVISGGGSALIGAPIEGVTLDDLRATTRALLAAGVPVARMNALRKHLGRAAGGRLAAACRARLDVLFLSDVIGDDASAVASGPFAADPTTWADALAAARDGGAPAAVRALCERGARGELEETPKASHARHHLVGSPATLLHEAALAARARFEVVRVLEPLEGDVSEVASRLAGEALSLEPGECVVAGGEPTVRLPADPGRGGRCQHLALLLARELRGRPLAFCAVGSDGNDGPTDAAGACIDGDGWAALESVGDPADAIARGDAYPLLDRAGLLVRTGPTGTNLLDLYLLASE
jgi:hydroxypyruvate reductase